MVLVMLRMHQPVTIIGGGLAGCEAALQLSAHGIAVELWEQRLGPAPADGAWTPAHTGSDLAELVCSNSLKSTDPIRAQGLLKEELRQLGCRLLPIADSAALPGGAALAVDRERFAQAVTEAVRSQPSITLIAQPFSGLQARLARADAGPAIIASGPLTSGALWAELSALVGSGGSYFFDATSPVLDAASIDRGTVFAQSRYGKGAGDDYLNCPCDQDEYLALREALLTADVYPLSAGDDYKLFEGCLPIEELALRGENTMRFGPLKPKGLDDPRTGRWPHAVVQLRWENTLHSALSLVGFQTRLRQGEQERVFRMIPGLHAAKFLRYGRMHRNSYLDAPRVLLPTLQLTGHPQVFIAGQLTGLEGYMSAIATGLWAANNVARTLRGVAPQTPPEGSCLGAMLRFMTHPGHRDYTPMAFQFGMHTWLPERIPKGEKRALLRQRAEEAWPVMREWL
jgi:methylenetetrahydrofolate--tRNA-(uracil-5-)-methyltransferase